MNKTEIVVVGAGFAGLSAARAAQLSGVKTLVLEAQDRVGGRAHTDRSVYPPIDLGGQWVGPGQHRILSLAREYGLATYASHADGRDVVVEGTQAQRIGKPIPPRVLAHAVTLLPTWASVRRLTRRIDPRNPWGLKDAAEWDALTVAAFLDGRRPSARARAWVEAIVRSEFCVEPESLSMLTLAASFAGSGGISSVSGEGSAQQDLFVDGADRLPQLMAAELDIHTQETVLRVSRANGALVVETDVTEYRAQRVIMATPPFLTRQIKFDPQLPAPLSAHLEHLQMGRVIKMWAIYDAPFWRVGGDSGMVLMPTGPASVVTDVSQPGGPGQLCILACGANADELAILTPAERQSRVLSSLAVAFGSAATHPRTWREKIWAEDPWALGGYSAVPAPRTSTPGSASVWQPWAGIHWAGSEVATEWPGYFEGAIRSGEDAARQAVSEIRLNER